ncbi:MAG: dihydrofolate reductase [Pseudomonadota bacterium]
MAWMALVVAADEGGVIGDRGRLPWHCPEDLAWFREVTMGKAMVMGRRTWEAIGRPLPGRDSVVLTRDPSWSAKGAHPARSLPEALDLAARLRPDAEEIAVIGGAEVFAEALPLADRIYWTAIPGRHPGDTRMPPVRWAEWRRTRRRQGEAATFAVYDRYSLRAAALASWPVA